MNIDSAFKLFDIRGEYPTEVDERLAFILGKSLSEWKKPSQVVVGSDLRASSPTLRRYLIDGLQQAGTKVFDLREVPIPQFYYTVATTDFPLGVMVTASHLNDSGNGFKIVKVGSLPLDNGEILTLKSLVEKNQKEAVVVPKKHPENIDTTKEYLQEVSKFFLRQKFSSRVIIDTTKSSVGTIVTSLYKELGINFQTIKSNHQGNPLIAQNRQDLAKAVIENSADSGIIWDSDGDRVVFVNRQGNLIPITFVIGLLGAQEVKKGKGDIVAVDVRAGLVTRDLVQEAGGKIEVFPAWHTTLKFAMIENPDIVFAGENSAHLIFKDFYRIDDGIVASLRFLQLYEQEGIEQKIKQLSKKYFELPESNFPCPLGKSSQILEKLTNYYRDKNLQVSIIDGLTVFGPDWKFNLRQSATEPLLRLNLEARSETEASKVFKTIENHIGL